MAVCSITDKPKTREEQILQLASLGLTDREMSERLGISTETIASYWRRIFARFGATNRTEVVAKAFRRENEDIVEENARLAAEIAERRRVERLLRDSNLRLFALMDSLPSGVLFEDKDRKVVFCNKGFLRMFKIPVEPRQLVGRDGLGLTLENSRFFAAPDRYAARIDEILEAGQPVTNEQVLLLDGSYLERDYVPVSAGADRAGHLWHYRQA